MGEDYSAVKRRILEDFRNGELGHGKRSIKLDNVSHHPEFNPNCGYVGFMSHVMVRGELEIELNGRDLVVTANVKDVSAFCEDSERTKRKINSICKERIQEADHYHPGKMISLYSKDWSFHCSLE